MKPLLRATLFILSMLTAPQLHAQAFTRADQCVVGLRVVDREGNAGSIKERRESGCVVKLDNGKTDYNLFWMLRPEGGKPGAANTPPGRQPAGDGTGELKRGKYQCYYLAGSSMNYAFIDIYIDSASAYRDQKGTGGKYRIEASKKIVFESGSMTKVNAQLLGSGKIGLNMSGGNFYNTTCNLKP